MEMESTVTSDIIAFPKSYSVSVAFDPECLKAKTEWVISDDAGGMRPQKRAAGEAGSFPIDCKTSEKLSNANNATPSPTKTTKAPAPIRNIRVFKWSRRNRKGTTEVRSAKPPASTAPAESELTSLR